MKDYMKIYQEWLSNPYFDEDTKAELKAIEHDENEIKERFYMDLEFGTAGLRGIIGAGINRMNIYVVRRATQGLANYIIKQGGSSKGVAIAYDSRHMSPEFADEAARTLAANGIKAYKFESLRPTPELSFAVRELGCIAGINVTASHNPPEYNGYKVYWEDGAQFTPPHDKGVTEEVLAIEDLSTVKTMSAEDAMAAGLYQVIGKEIDDKYIAMIGYWVSRPETRTYDRWIWIAALLSFLKVVLSVNPYVYWQAYVNYYVHMAPLSIFMACGIFALALHKKPERKHFWDSLVMMFGKHSFTILLLHWWVLYHIVIYTLNLDITWKQPLVFAGTVIFVILASFAYGFLIDQTVVYTIRACYEWMVKHIQRIYQK
jgi:hypothetical protein